MPAKQSGSALISALFIMALIAMAATAMSLRLQADIYRTRLAIINDELYLASQAVQFWSMDILSKPLAFSYNQKGGKLASFPRALQTSYPGVQLQGELFDAQAFYNINNLQDTRFHSIFYKLLEKISPTKSTDQFVHLIRAIYDWITPYQANAGHNPFVAYYLKQHPPYYPAHQVMQSVSELTLVQDMTSSLFQNLHPYLIALPTVTPININSAPALLIKCLGNGLSDSQLSELLQLKTEKGMTDPQIFNQLIQKLAIPPYQVTLESEYFLLKTTATNADLKLTVYRLLKRQKTPKGTIQLSLIRESQGID